MNGNINNSYKRKGSSSELDQYLHSLTPVHKKEGATHTPVQRTAPRTPSNLGAPSQTPPAPDTTPRNQPPPTPAPFFPIMDQEGPPVMDYRYIAGYLKNHIGSFVKAEFVVGTSQYMDKNGTLVEVGVNYFVLEELISRHKVLCDLYSVKFITFFNGEGDI